MMILRLAESSRLHISSFLFVALWKLIFRIFILRTEGVIFFLRVAVGEEQDIGGPGLDATVATEESNMLKGLSEECTIKDSNKLE